LGGAEVSPKTREPEPSVSELGETEESSEARQPEASVSELGGTAVPPETSNAVDHDGAKEDVTTVDISHVANPEVIGQGLWTPFVLTPLGLSLFFIAFFALLIATVALFIVSNKKGGIASVNSNYYYLWDLLSYCW